MGKHSQPRRTLALLGMGIGIGIGTDIGMIDAVWAQDSVTGTGAFTSSCNQPNYPECLAVPITDTVFGDQFKVPAPQIIPSWSSWVGTQVDPDYEIPDEPPTTSGTPYRPGNPNGAGIGWQQPGNLASELVTCGPKQWGFTFDDGPSDNTPEVMQFLAAERMTATFFVIGSNVVRTPAYSKALKDLHAAGHQIALHTWSHRRLTTQSTDSVIAEIVWNAVAVYQTIGKVPKYFRPPYGDIDDRVRNIVAAMGLRTVIWDILADDTALSPEDTQITAPVAPSNGTNSNSTTVIATTPNTPAGWHIYNIIARYQSVIANGYMVGLNWFSYPSQPPYSGFISLNHETYKSMVLAAKQVVPLIRQGGFSFVSVAACDQAVYGSSNNADGSMYLPDNHPFVKFISGINLPISMSLFRGSGNVYDNGAGYGGNANSGTSSPRKKNSEPRLGAIKGTGPVIAMSIFIAACGIAVIFGGFWMYRRRKGMAGKNWKQSTDLPITQDRTLEESSLSHSNQPAREAVSPGAKSDRVNEWARSQ